MARNSETASLDQGAEKAENRLGTSSGAETRVGPNATPLREESSPRHSMIAPKRPGQVSQADLSYRFLDPRANSSEVRARLADAYACWSGVWRPELRELNQRDIFSSDDFTRQDEIGVLFVRDCAVAMSGFRWIDAAFPASRHDSYFRAWPDRAFEELTQRGSHVCVVSYLTVAADWRGERLFCPALQIITEMLLKRFQASDADVMAATSRNDRKINRVAYSYGGRPLGTSRMHGVDVDLLAFSPEDVDFSVATPVQRLCIDELWENAWRSHEYQSHGS